MITEILNKLVEKAMSRLLPNFAPREVLNVGNDVVEVTIFNRSPKFKLNGKRISRKNLEAHFSN